MTRELVKAFPHDGGRFGWVEGERPVGKNGSIDAVKNGLVVDLDLTDVSRSRPSYDLNRLNLKKTPGSASDRQGWATDSCHAASAA